MTPFCRRPIGIALLALGTLGVPVRSLSEAQRPPAANVIRAIDVADAGDGIELSIRGTRAPSYTVFKLQEPPRLVLDLAGADVSAIATPLAVAKGGVREVTTAQYSDSRSAVGRIVIALEGSPRYEVSARGDSLVVQVAQAAAETRPIAAAATAAAPTEPAGREVPTAAAPAPVDAPQAESNVVSRRVDEKDVSRPATAVTGVKARSGGLLVALDGEVARFEVLELTSPPRIALDLYGVRKAPRAAVPLDGAFRQARFGRDEGKIRVVVDAAGDLPRFDAKRVRGGIAIAPVAVAEQRVRAAPARTAEPRPVPAAGALIDDLRFSQTGVTARVELQGKPERAVTRTDARTLVLTLRNARLVHKLERSIDASGFQGPVAMLSSFNQPDGDARVVLTLRADATETLAETESGLAWTVTAKGDPAEAKADAPHATAAEAQVAAATAQAPSAAVSAQPARREYTGRRVTLDFHDVEIRNLLRLIADVSKKNIVVADDVSGKVTVSLKNVPWDQALDLVLRAKGLDKEEMGNVIRIAKIEEIAKEQRARAEAAKARQPLIPLRVRLIPVNFARAGDVASRVKDVLSERGTISTDERTNVLIVKDVAEALARAEGLVRNLDTETPQVRIESRIVEASSNFNRQIGVQWGGNASLSPGTGNPTGLFFPNVVTAGGAAGQAPSDGTSSAPNYAVNLPAAIGQGQGGGVGFTFGSAGGAFNLNLRLSALENSGVVKTISAPSVSTIDNKEATIGQGLSIPFSQVSASGVNTVFVEAKLELKVTPHVTADGTVLLKIKVTNNSPNPQLTGANGQPSISKREAETEALVKDGETTVIGGIYTRQTSNRVAEVPFFGKIPILGWFFRSNSNQDDHTELLIFITPRILNRPVAAADIQ